MTVDDSGALSEVVVRSIARHHTGTAESLTGGLVCAALTDVPGASATVRERSCRTLWKSRHACS